jgi:hypothetical protein
MDCGIQISDLMNILNKMDCMSNSCRFKGNYKKGQIRHNGGCMCLKSLPTELRIWIEKTQYLYLKD